MRYLRRECINVSNVQDVLQSFLLFDEKGEMPKSARVLAFGAQTTNAALLWTRPDLVGAKQAPANCAALRQGDKYAFRQHGERGEIWKDNRCLNCARHQSKFRKRSEANSPGYARGEPKVQGSPSMASAAAEELLTSLASPSACALEQLGRSLSFCWSQINP